MLIPAGFFVRGAIGRAAVPAAPLEPSHYRWWRVGASSRAWYRRLRSPRSRTSNA